MTAAPGDGPVRKWLVGPLDGRVIAACLEDGLLTDLVDDRPALRNRIFLGRVKRIVAGLGIAFVDIGTGQDGALPLPRRRLEWPAEGSARLVQVSAEAAGGKGAKLTDDLVLPGRLLMLTPATAGVALSKRIGGPATRRRLRAWGEAALEPATPPGLVVRAEATGAAIEALDGELAALLERWTAIKKAAAAASAPTPLDAMPELGGIVTALTSGAADRILVADRRLAGRLAEAARSLGIPLPALAIADGTDPLAEDDTDEQIAGLGFKEVLLESGGRMTVEATRGLTAIDIDAGDAGDDSRDWQGLVSSVNRAAAAEIPRQLRLRRIGGVILVDFLKDQGRTPGRDELEALLSADAPSAAGLEILGWTRGGLLEMRRRRHGSAP